MKLFSLGGSPKDYVAELGNNVEREWRRFDYQHAILADVARDVLARERAHERITGQSIIDLVMSEAHIPFQQSFESTFGEPPVTLFWHPHFYIEALFWDAATPSIHNHAFSGAFAVIQGSSLQTTYTFEPDVRSIPELQFGVLRARGCELLTVGDIEIVRPRDGLIHSVCHLDSPSVTLVVRSHSEVNREARYEYIPPTVAWDPTFVDQRRTRRLQLLKLMARTSPSAYVVNASQLIATSDLVTAFLVLRQAVCEVGLGNDGLTVLSEATKRRWPDRSEHMVLALQQLHRQQLATRLRRVVRTPESRLFLGLLTAHHEWFSLRAAVTEVFKTPNPANIVAEQLLAFAQAGALQLPISREDIEPLARWLETRHTARLSPKLVDAIASLRSHPAVSVLTEMEPASLTTTAGAAGLS